MESSDRYKLPSMKEVTDVLVSLGGVKIKDNVIRFEYFKIDYHRKKLNDYVTLDILIVIDYLSCFDTVNTIFLFDSSKYVSYETYKYYDYCSIYRNLNHLLQESYDESLLDGYCPAIRHNRNWKLLPHDANSPIIANINNPKEGSKLIFEQEYIDKYKIIYSSIIKEIIYYI